MSKKIRMYAGGAVVIIWVAYFAFYTLSRIASTPREVGHDTMHFLSSMPNLPANLMVLATLALAWTVLSMCHGYRLAVSREGMPDRKMAATCTLLFAALVLLIKIHGPFYFLSDAYVPAYNQLAEAIADDGFILAVLVTVTTQLLDLGLKPWPKVPDGVLDH